MFGRKKKSFDGKTYARSLRSKSPEHRFYERLVEHNKQYDVGSIARVKDRLERKRRKRIQMKIIKRLEK